MRYLAPLGVAIFVFVSSLSGFPGGVCHALERHPKDSDKTNGYWCFDCHKFQNKTANASWVRTEIKVKAPDGGVVNVDYPVAGAYVKDAPPFNGPCQACHTTTNHYRNDGSGFDHFIGADCLTCHSHFQKNMFTLSFVGSQSHATHLIDAVTGNFDSKGPAIADCTVCHYGSDYSRFGPEGETIEDTDVCDGCHSAGGAFDGVNDLVVGAKPNWVDGIYRPTGKKLQEGKGNWCATCHDDGSSVIEGISAPNVMGDNATYGYNVSGHGRKPSNYVQCEGCHDLSAGHIDGFQRTYVAAGDKPKKSYEKGYRLNDDMTIPRNGEGAETSFTLCANCHPYGQVIDKTTTNFKDDIMPFSYHSLHLKSYPTIQCWDSDWNGKADSAMSCPACHNVHGSPTPAMIRHGELISSPGTTNKVPALDFRWYQADGTTKTTRLENSVYGALECATISNLTDGNLQLQHNHVCWGCHPVGPDNPTLIRYKRTPVTQGKVKVTEVWTTDPSGNRKEAFAVGEDISYRVNFTIIGDSGPYFVKSLGKQSHAFNTSGSDWDTKLVNSQTLPAGVVHEWIWDATIPAAAEPGSEANVTIQLRLFDSEGGSLIDKDKGSHAFTIAP